MRHIVARLRILWSFMDSSSKDLPLRPGVADKHSRNLHFSQNVGCWHGQLLGNYCASMVGLLENGFVVTKLEHRKLSSDSKWAHEVILVTIHDQASGLLQQQDVVFVFDRDFHPQSIQAPIAESDIACQPEIDPPDDNDCIVRSTGNSCCGGSLGTSINTVGKVFDDHKALDVIHRGTSDATKTASASDLLLTVDLSLRPIPLLRFSILVSTVSKYSPIYHITRHQCFWFAWTICELVVDIFGGEATEGPDFQKRGTWHMTRLQYLSHCDALKKEYEKKILGFQCIWEKQQKRETDLRAQLQQEREERQQEREEWQQEQEERHREQEQIRALEKQLEALTLQANTDSSEVIKNHGES